MTRKIEQWQSVDSQGVPTYDFRISRPDVRDVTGAYWLPKNEKVRGLLCFGHGASGDRYQQPVSKLAEQMLSNGVAVLSLDGPDHGLRQQHEGGRMGMVRDLGSDQALEQMSEDWDRAIIWLTREKALGPVPLVYFGLSMGTAYGLSLVNDQANIRGAVLGLWGLMPPMPQNEKFAAHARAIDCPILFLAQSDDEFIPMTAYADLFRAIGSANKRMHVNPGVHAEIPLDEVAFSAAYILELLRGEHAGAERAMLPIVDVP